MIRIPLHQWLRALCAAAMCPADAAASSRATLAAPGGIKTAAQQLIEAFERETGHRVEASFGSGGGTKQRVLDGEPIDVPIVQPPLESVVACGHVIPDSMRPLASCAVAMAVKKGAPHPDISTPDALRRTLLAARTVSCPNGALGAAAGVSFERTLATLGIAAEIEPKLRRIRGGWNAMTAIADGEVELGVTFRSEIDNPGVEVVGALPAAVSKPTEFVAFLSVRAAQSQAARALIAFLSAPAAHAVYRANGMEPLS